MNYLKKISFKDWLWLAATIFGWGIAMGSLQTRVTAIEEDSEHVPDMRGDIKVLKRDVTEIKEDVKDIKNHLYRRP